MKLKVRLMKKLKSYYYGFLYWKGERQKTTPKKLLTKFNKQGVSSTSITAEDIHYIYQKLKPWKSSSTLASMEKIKNAIGDDLYEINVLPDQILGVIVETRPHENLYYVIQNFINCTGLRVQLFHGNNNLDFIMSSEIKRLIANKQVFLTPLNLSTLTASYYNSLFLSESFWLMIKGRCKVLVFQADTICCPNSPYKLNDFYNFDYIGAVWHNRLMPNGLILDGGVGGFSFRDYFKSLEALKRFPSENWQGSEDDFFAFHIELIGGQVGTKQECAKFCTQNNFTSLSFAAHQLSNLNKEDKLKFLRYCPEAEFLM